MLKPVIRVSAGYRGRQEPNAMASGFQSETLRTKRTGKIATLYSKNQETL